MQPSWGDKPTGVTVISLPDGFVYYCEPRIPTVREWARLQTLPDWYVFKGPRTTGGRRRAGDPSKKIFDRDVPKYTQIGNAVPVRLAYELGMRVARLLRDSAWRIIIFSISITPCGALWESGKCLGCPIDELTCTSTPMP